VTMLAASGLRFAEGTPITVRIHVPLPAFNG
jgi:hypothetical protein